MIQLRWRMHLAAMLLALAAGALALGLSSAGCGLIDRVSDGDAVDEQQQEDRQSQPLKLGLLLNFSGSPETSADRQRAFELAIRHANEAGGVFGLPVQWVVADATGDPDRAAAEARRLVQEEGVHALVGPNASSASLPVSQSISAIFRIPTISSSATSPLLTDADDNDYFFRSALSDVAQGPVLAGLIRQQGFDNVGLIYQHDAYGGGLAGSFADSWDGALSTVSIDAEAATPSDVSAAIGDSSRQGAQALVIIAFEQVGISIVRQAVASGTYSRFFFSDSLKRESIPREVGVEAVAWMYGTGSAQAPQTAATQAWNSAFEAAYGALPVQAFVEETYDAAAALLLAAEAAGTVNGEAMRDQLRNIANSPGERIPGSADGIATGLAMVRDGKVIDYDGTSGVLEWDENGDVSRGYTGIWRFTAEGTIQEIESVPYER